MDRIHELTGLIGIVATLLGVWLQVRRGDFASEAEERVKDGKWTEAEARKRVWLIAWSAGMLTAIGVVCLGLAAVQLFG